MTNDKQDNKEYSILSYVYASEIGEQDNSEDIPLEEETEEATTEEVTTEESAEVSEEEIEVLSDILTTLSALVKFQVINIIATCMIVAVLCASGIFKLR